MREVTIDTTEIQMIVRNYYVQSYDKTLDNLGKIDKFLETYTLPKLDKEESESLNRLVTTTEKLKS